MITREAVVRFLKSTTCRLALTYLSIIMLMSVGFSVAFYHTSSHQLGRQLPPRTVFGGMMDIERYRPSVEEFFQQRIDEGRHELIQRLILINFMALIAGGGISYLLARRALEPIESAMEAQSQFVGDASHELRTPLTAIQTSNEVALRKPKLTLEEAKTIIRDNTTEAIKLRGLSDALLKLARNENQTLKLKAVALQEVVADAMNNIVAAAQAKDIEVTDKTPNIKVLAHRQSLEQIITILLDNAIKYSDSRGDITIKAVVKNKQVTIIVQDHGIGIRASDLPHVFKRFYRADRSRSKDQRDGYGLGLAIADTLIRQQHGEIVAESTPGKGSTFSIKLPLA